MRAADTSSINIDSRHLRPPRPRPSDISQLTNETAFGSIRFAIVGCFSLAKELLALSRNFAVTHYEIFLSETLSKLSFEGTLDASPAIFFLLVRLVRIRVLKSSANLVVDVVVVLLVGSYFRTKLRLELLLDFPSLFFPKIVPAIGQAVSTRLVWSIAESIRRDVTRNLHRVRAQSNRYLR